MKKLNITNPADSIMQFISSVQDEHNELDSIVNEKKKIPIQNRPKNDKNGKELKRKRFNLLFIPSLFNDIEKIAYVEKMSINEAINQALILYRESKKEALEKYIEIEKLRQK